MAQIVIHNQTDSNKTATHPLTPRDTLLVVGRNRTCHIVLADPTVSREQCELRRCDYGYTVTDYGKRNPTQINHKIVSQETLLQSGDILRVGKTEMAIHYDTGEFPPPPPISETTTRLNGNTEIGRHIFGYKPVTREEAEAMPPPPHPAPRAADAPVVPAPGDEKIPETSDILKTWRACRIRNDLIAKFLLWLLFAGLPSAGIIWFFWSQNQ